MHTTSSHSLRVHIHNVLPLFKCKIKHGNTYIVHRPTTLHGVLVFTGRSVLPMKWKAHWLLPQDQKANQSEASVTCSPGGKTGVLVMPRSQCCTHVVHYTH